MIIMMWENAVWLVGDQVRKHRMGNWEPLILSNDTRTIKDKLLMSPY